LHPLLQATLIYRLVCLAQQADFAIYLDPTLQVEFVPLDMCALEDQIHPSHSLLLLASLVSLVSIALLVH
jgi:hypothetical protein